MEENQVQRFSRVLKERFGEGLEPGDEKLELELLTSMASRASCREFENVAIGRKTVRLLCAIALSSPSKSDLQQRDIVIVDDPQIKARLLDLISGETWVCDAPSIVVFCGNNRRQRLVQKWRDHVFANDHLDAFFNASVDAAIALSAFVTAAEAMGLGCCPISAVRNEASEVSTLLKLPHHVFPVAGLAFGYPAQTKPTLSLRLPLDVTIHQNQYSEDDLFETVKAYDERREAVQPYPAQRACDIFGTSGSYSWSEDKARQYGLPERKNFGAFVRAKGFELK